MVACGTLREQYNLDNSSKPLTQRIQAQGRMAEPEVVSTCLKTEQEDLRHCLAQRTEGLILGQWQGQRK